LSSLGALLLYGVFALGAAGVYLLLPRGERTRALPGAVVGVLALTALLVVLSAEWVAPQRPTAYFYLFSAVALIGACRVVTHSRPVYSALYFVLVVVAVAALLVLQDAEFLAVALIIIYAGAILVTYLFVIMLAQQSTEPTYDRYAREPLLAVLGGFVLMAAVAGKAGDVAAPNAVRTLPVVNQVASETDGPGTISAGNVAAVGASVMTRYVVALQIGGVLLLVAMVGAVALSKKRVPAEGFQQPARPIGQVGKEALPF